MPPTPPASSGKPSPVLILFLIFPLLGILAALAFGLSQTAQQTAPPTPLPVPPEPRSLLDKPAPNFDLPTLAGGSQRLSSYRGRVVFLNFWATWCEPCKREMPAFEAFQTAQGPNGAAILALNVGETAEHINAFFAENAVGTGLMVLLDPDLAAYNLYNIERMPTTFVIDPAGVVRYKHLGEMTEADLEAYVARVGGA